MRLIVVVGARPNFVKVGPLMPALHAAGFDAAIAHTGQHYDAAMSDVFFADLNLEEPRWFLNVGSGTHAVQTGTAMIRLEELFEAERPDGVIVVGDVNSTLAAALAAAKVHIPVIHLEAGLRSGDMSMPEEVNRLVTDQISSMHLAPTQDAVEHLLNEAVDERRIHFVGNIMAEAVLRNLDEIEQRKVCAQHDLTPKSYILATTHRPENTDHPERLAHVVAALGEAPLPVLMPVHPRTRPMMATVGLGEATRNIHLIDPVGYLDMLSLQRDAALVVTDSGGMQEESCMLGTPCVTIRRNTERVVTLAVGSNRLVAADRDAIMHAMSEGLASGTDWEVPEKWDDQVAARVVEALKEGIQPPSGY